MKAILTTPPSHTFDRYTRKLKITKDNITLVNCNASYCVTIVLLLIATFSKYDEELLITICHVRRTIK